MAEGKIQNNKVVPKAPLVLNRRARGAPFLFPRFFTQSIDLLQTIYYPVVIAAKRHVLHAQY